MYSPLITYFTPSPTFQWAQGTKWGSPSDPGVSLNQYSNQYPTLMPNKYAFTFYKTITYTILNSDIFLPGGNTFSVRHGIFSSPILNTHTHIFLLTNSKAACNMVTLYWFKLGKLLWDRSCLGPPEVPFFPSVAMYHFGIFLMEPSKRPIWSNFKTGTNIYPLIVCRFVL